MNDIRERIVSAARRRVGAPWTHQGRSIDAGFDCVGLLTETARECGLTDFDMRNYEKTPNGKLLAICREQMTEIPVSAMQPGDAVVIAYESEPMHVGIIAPYAHGEGNLAIIHAARQRGKVCEHRIDASLRRLIVAAFRPPGVPE